MNAPTFNLNPNLAKEGSEGAGFQKITTSGAYTGIITKAKFVTAKSGTTGIEFAFECVSGATADYITIWLTKPDGTQLSAHKVLHALLMCLKVKEAAPVDGQVEEWNSATNKREIVSAVIYPALMNVPIGLLLQAEEYQKDNGDIKTSMNLFAPFVADTKQMAIEVLDTQPPSALDRIMPTVKDKKLPQARSQQATQQQSGQQQPPADIYDDDVPF